jgi:Domain of unknown function (DUF5658)
MVGWLWAWWLMNAADAFTTATAIVSGKGREANPIPATLVGSMGVYGALCVKVLGVVIVTSFIVWKWRASRPVRVCAWVAFAAVTLTVVGNVGVLAA